MIGLPGLYKSVAGTTDYKNDTLQFIMVEEDHLETLSQEFFGPNAPPPQQEMNLFSKCTLKQLMDRILPNPLLIDLFASDQTLICQVIVQTLQALASLNDQGFMH